MPPAGRADEAVLDAVNTDALEYGPSVLVGERKLEPLCSISRGK